MKKVIITGTSRGIGFELAQQFAKNNFQVLALSRNQKPLDNLKLKNIETLSVDVCNQDDLQKVSKYLSEHWGDVDILIHNAGFLINKPFESLTKDDFLRVYDVNVFGVAALTQICIPYLKKGSHVVTISSMGGIQGSLKFPGLAAYSSAKGAVITLSELLAEEYKSAEIAFNVLAIGAVQTEMLAEAFPDYQASLNANEMADYIFNFATTANKFYNGKVLQVSNTTP
ncbi:SDR family oxidoreductase [Flavobacteriaceae bacterium]|jgi:3-oxoacyl-[acyl-carrier protein] reductase|nr:SDR family oxidoreductase [Flavobacteriaceae bacterium]MDB2418726.1 SDR family oxidoreductase [Flavobacteriaceae bacterium]MDB2625301.1 SDR family oxidoreductase [Flavobacteriaceae bacterium]MDG1161108.1 SDR family NAD(P)-dependent oxidoreductase [Flavobacteriaceae bacterium]MDG1981113.1 SDR family NAD(P)-dependent oxidoreductase [Flavobacteriaceae bacterium]|tara:strand:+ start:2564 stop:3244 length:681 start_codon:yes stop_codon:yes gene_type:complete